MIASHFVSVSTTVQIFEVCENCGSVDVHLEDESEIQPGDKPLPRGMRVPTMALPDLRTVHIPAGIPPGLAYLGAMDEVNIHQHPDEFPGYTKTNKYMLCNSSDEQFMSVKEESNCMARLLCGTSRSFEMNFMDNSGQTLIQLYRPLRCTPSFLWCFCLHRMYIMSPPGCPIAWIRQLWTLWRPKYEVLTGHDRKIFSIVGEPDGCGADRLFKITDKDEKEVGRISKQRARARDMCGQPSNFKLEYTAELDVFNKSVLLGATFLIDFVNLECCN